MEAVPVNLTLGLLPLGEATGKLTGAQRAWVKLLRFKTETDVVELGRRVGLTPGRIREQQDAVVTYARALTDHHGAGATIKDLASHPGEALMRVWTFEGVREALAPRTPGVDDAVG